MRITRKKIRRFIREQIEVHMVPAGLEHADPYDAYGMGYNKAKEELDCDHPEWTTACVRNDEEDYATPGEALGIGYSIGRDEQEIRNMIREVAYDYFGDKGTGRQAKKDFAALADQQSLQSLVYVHWAGIDNIEKLISNEANWKRNELSASIYRAGDIATLPVHMSTGKLDMTGVVIEGYVTFAANRDLQSGWTMAVDYSRAGLQKGTPNRKAAIQKYKSWAKGDYEKMHRTASSGWGKVPRTPESPWGKAQPWSVEWTDHVVYNADDLVTSPDGLQNEALIDNWRILRVIKPGEAL